MTQIHGRHLQCNKCYRHYFQSHLFSYYHSGLEEDANESKLARFIYSPNCKLWNNKDYTVIGDYGYDYDAARKAVDDANRNASYLQEHIIRKIIELKSKDEGND